jgi:multimeric flavodoxin WrbA
MKILGLNFGRRLYNCDTLMRTALIGAEKKGAETAFIQMSTLTIKPCNSCFACAVNKAKGKENWCVIQDDLNFVENELLDADAVIVAAPIYSVGPNGMVKCMTDRMGFRNDRAFCEAADNKRLAACLPPMDKRLFKDRYAALITVGGAVTPNWVCFGLPGLHLLTFSMQMHIVDQMNVYRISQLGHVAIHEDLMGRAARLGENLTAECGKPFSDDVWYGDEQGVCPVCHNNLLMVGDTTKVECPVCGISGEISVEEGRLKVDWPVENRLHSREYIGGLEDHRKELEDNSPIGDACLEKGKKEFQLKMAVLKEFGYREIKPIKEDN